MKKFLIVVAAVTIFNSMGLSQGRKFQNMVGNWEMVGEQDSGGSLQIIDSSTILIRFMGKEKRLLEYRIDFSKSPYWFDFSAKDTATVIYFKSLIEFVNDDMLKWQVFVDEDRTDHFTSGSGDLFYLRRVQRSPTSIAANSKQ